MSNSLIIPSSAAPAQELTAEVKTRVLSAIALAEGPNADFALSLLMAVRKGKVSEAQQFHIDRLVNRHLNPLPEVDATRIIKAYQSLPATMKRFPKVRATIGGVEVSISYTPPFSLKAKPENCGTCAIASGKWGSPDAKWYGRIMANGKFVPGHDATPEIVAWVAALADGSTEIVWQF